MSNLAIVERELPAVTSEQLDLIKRTVASGATDAELKLFLFDCQRRGVHPLDKLLHFTKRGGKYTPVTSIDFMRSQAAMTGEMAGSDDPRFEEGEHQPIAATVTVYRLTQGQRFAYSATARWAEYCPDNAPMWKRMPRTMLGKCAEALALRKAFPQQLAGLYTTDEMDQAGPSNGGYTVEAPTPAPLAIPPMRERENPIASSGEIGRGSDPVVAVTVDVTTGEELPAGAVLITKVESGWEGSPEKGFVFTASGKAGLAVYREELFTLALEVCQRGEPVFLELKKSAAGKSYVVGIRRAIQKPSAEPIPTDSEIPF